jgi:hypothetical protein
MNKVASKILWWEGVVLAALALARHIAWLAGFEPELTMVGLITAGCLAFAALSMALSRTRICGLSPWLAVLSSFGLGIGFMIVGFLASVPIPLVSIIGATLALAALAIVTAGATMCKQEAGMRMDKPLRVASLLLAMYVLARILMEAVTVTWFSVHDPVGMIANGFFAVLLLFLSAVAVMLSLSTRWPKDSIALSSVLASAFVAGSILVARASSAWYVSGGSGNVLLRMALGVALLFPSFLRRRLR